MPGGYQPLQPYRYDTVPDPDAEVAEGEEPKTKTVRRRVTGVTGVPGVTGMTGVTRTPRPCG